MSKFRVLATQAQVAIHACAFHVFAMQANTLEELWHHARTGKLSAWSEAKAWPLREVWQQLFKKDSVYGLNAWVAKRLKKAGGGRPTRQAIGQLFQKVDDDNKWFPGKLMAAPGGARLPFLGQTNLSSQEARWPSLSKTRSPRIRSSWQEIRRLR